MVTETKESMKHTMDAMANGVEAGFEAGRKAQKAWFDAFNNFYGMAGWEKVMGQEGFAKEFVPMVAKHSEAMVDCFESAFKSNFKAVSTAFDGDTNDVFGSTRSFWDNSFDAARTNFEQFSKSGRVAFDDWSQFWSQRQVNGVAATNGKSASKTGK